jgi:hypothetical protein
LSESRPVSVQDEPQNCWLIGHSQAPAMHAWPVPQPCPHIPQSVALVSSSTQAPLQAAWPAAHAIAHVPLEQTSPSLQAVPQVPQCWGSVIRLAQVSPHFFSSPAQRHLPVAQNIFVPQVIPQPPQFFGSLARSTQVKVVLAGGQGLSASAHATRGPPPFPRRGPAESSPAGASAPASGTIGESPSFFGELQATIRDTRTKDRLFRITLRSSKTG